MTAVLQKWGNSQGVRLPKKTLDDLSLKVGDRVEIVEENDKIIITPIRKNTKYNINELVAKIPSHYEQSEQSFGSSVGAEKW